MGSNPTLTHSFFILTERREKYEFCECIKTESSLTYTENGAVALNTTGDARLDLFSTIGALRNADEGRIQTLFAEAYKADPLFAVKILFYARDIRGGLGERRVFQVILKYLAEYHPNAIIPNLDLIGVFGRYDDLYCLIGTQIEDSMWETMKKQFEEDLANYREGQTVSLLAKWIKTADSKNEPTRKLGILTAQKLGYSVYEFKRLVRALRKHIGVIETYMSKGEWDRIKYSEVPSRAMMIYRNAFRMHDEIGFSEFINRAVEGKEKINSSTLYPYDIVEKILYNGEDDKALEAQWRQLPNYLSDDMNALVIADVSGSMWGRPLATSIGLAMYFAERNKGVYQNLFMTFSWESEIIAIKGETLKQKIEYISKAEWGMNTNLKAAFEKVLDIAISNQVPADELPKAVIVISDMEIDGCCGSKWTFYEEMKRKFAVNGYEIPNIIFWNVNSRHDVFHSDGKRVGVQLFSGQSAATFKQLMECVGLTPIQMMENVIHAERYDCIKVE